ncbi:DUF1566 domain-containing protein [Halosquirtibacter xylanolyticus]|uniref:hypothetical protein n=1 Tax=Halosquirtibacter xylanolyticus TaxID=3374599 RepID=UPI003748AB5B|nr:DUF1566 domain-containing protein [Prolixibacteraceae bacterium]
MKSHLFNKRKNKGTVLLFLFILVFSWNTKLEAQNVSISDIKNAPAEATAVLDIYSNDKGVLVPRVELKGPNDPISGVKPNGLLVYNTVASATYKVEGFYFWKGTDWMPLGQDIYEIDARAHYIGTATSASNADYLLDQVCVNLQSDLDKISTTAGSPAQVLKSINATRTGAGLDVPSGNYVVKADGNYISSATSIHDATIRLDNTLNAVDARSASNSMAVNRNITKIDEINKTLGTIGGGSTGTQDELDRTQRSLGLGKGGEYKPITSAHYVSTAKFAQEEVFLLDKALHATDTELAVNRNLVTRIDNDNTAIQVKIAQNETNITDLQSKVDNTIAAAGFTKDGDYSKPTSSNYLNGSTSLQNADLIIDQKVKENSTKVTNIITTTSNLQKELDATQAGSGLQADGSYAPIAAASYINTAASLQNESFILDGKVREVKLQIGDHTARIEGVENRTTALETSVNDHTTQIGDLTTKTNNIENTQTDLQNKTNNIITGAGLNADGSYAADLTGSYTNTATSLADADKKLDVAIKDLSDSYNNKFGAEGVVEAQKGIVADNNKDVKGYNKIVVGSNDEKSPSAAMEVNSTTRGFLFPRMTSNEIKDIKNPAEGLVVYNLTQHIPVFFNGSRWMTYGGRPMDVVVGDRLWGGIVFSVNSGKREVLIVSEASEEYTDYTTSVAKAQEPFSGYSDWRLPNQTELQSLFDNYKASFGTNGEYWVDSTAGGTLTDALFFTVSSNSFALKKKVNACRYKKVRSQKY